MVFFIFIRKWIFLAKTLRSFFFILGLGPKWSMGESIFFGSWGVDPTSAMYDLNTGKVTSFESTLGISLEPSTISKI